MPRRIQKWKNPRSSVPSFTRLRDGARPVTEHVVSHAHPAIERRIPNFYGRLHGRARVRHGRRAYGVILNALKIRSHSHLGYSNPKMNQESHKVAVIHSW